MSIIVGYRPNLRGQAALNLASVLARSTDKDLVVCAVLDTPSKARSGGSSDPHLDNVAQSTLDHARARLPADITAQFTARYARSVPNVLLQVAEQYQATGIVLESSASGTLGYITLSSVADWLLHSSTVPVALAPRGFKCNPDERINRVTVAFDGSGKSGQFVAAVRHAIATTDARLRVASFAVQRPPPATARMHLEADSVMNEWADDIRVRATRMLGSHTDTKPATERLEIAVGHGHNWYEAVENIGWEPEGELLVVGSSQSGPLARVFLGYRAAKIIKASPVPVMVVPAGTHAKASR